jgi:hypothetical protein
MNTENTVQLVGEARKEMRNAYMDLSEAFYSCSTFAEFCKLLPKVLPFIAAYHSEMLTGALIEEIEQTEIRLKLASK